MALGPDSRSVPVVAAGDLERALTLRAETDGVWGIRAEPNYEAANGMYGGWTAAVLLRSAWASAGDGVKPSSITVNFVHRVEAGVDLHVRVRRVGGGRSVSHWLCELSPSDGTDVLAIATV